MGEAGDERLPNEVVLHSASRLTLNDRAHALFNFACAIEIEREGVSDDYKDDSCGVDQNTFGSCTKARAVSHWLLHRGG